MPPSGPTDGVHLSMAGLYENRALDLIEKAKRYLASYDRLHFYTVAIDPDHTLIPEKDIEFPSRSIASGLVSFWLLAYWTLRRLERR